jgi:hypothetical protein
LYGHICFCKCKLFPFFPRFVIVTYYLGVLNKCDNGSRRVFVRPVKKQLVPILLHYSGYAPTCMTESFH